LRTRKNELHLGRSAFAVASCAAALLSSGCAERKAHAFPWATAVLVRPLPPAERPANAADTAPDLRLEPPQNGGRILVVRPAPPRPHVNTPAASDPTNSAKSSDLAPELSPQEIAAAKEQVAESMRLTEHNLAVARGKKLSPAQSDVLSKIVGFIAEAREASSEGDWARARNLAKKAQILSQDLAASF